MTRIANSIGIVSVLVVVGSVLPAMAVDVKLRERIVPKSSVVRLGDVAEIASADRQQARELAAVPLMPAPAPETERFLRKREIADMLQASGVNLGDIRFDGAEKVAVMGPDGVRTVALSDGSMAKELVGGVSDADEAHKLQRGIGLREASHSDFQSVPINRHAAILAGETAKAALPPLDNSQAAAVKVELCRIIGEYVKTKTGKAATGRIECNVTDRQLAQVAAATTAPVCAGGSEPWAGRQKFILSFKTANESVQIPVYADVSEPAVPVVVATRPVARGNVITAADVEVRTLAPTAKMAGQRAVVDTVEKIIGMEARQPLQAGEVVFADQVQSPVLVKRGDLITVSSQSGGIRVRTSARALQDGANGTLIQVESLESKQRYVARVVGQREAAVFAPARVIMPQPPERAQTARRPLNNFK